MKRIIPTFVAGVAVLMLMFRGLKLESGNAHDATNSSAAANLTDEVFLALGDVSSAGFPNVMFVAVLALACALALGVGWK